jgi:ribonuclease III
MKPRRAAPPAARGRDLSRLESRLGYPFRDRALLERALTHSSYAHEIAAGPDNEAMEFLGDAALGFLVSEALLRRFPEMDEGGLSKLKAFLVSRGNLAAVSRRIGLGSYLRLGRTAERGQGRVKESLLADALEAVLAAAHLDGGEAATRPLIGRLFGEQIDGLDRVAVEGKDFKTSLQEALQARGRSTPRYRVEATEGPPHRPTFHVGVLVDGEELARGKGGSKKEAEQRAARLALRRIGRPAP